MKAAAVRSEFYFNLHVREPFVRPGLSAMISRRKFLRRAAQTAAA